jgi:hypothetical protein
MVIRNIYGKTRNTVRSFPWKGLNNINDLFPEWIKKGLDKILSTQPPMGNPYVWYGILKWKGLNTTKPGNHFLLWYSMHLIFDLLKPNAKDEWRMWISQFCISTFVVSNEQCQCTRKTYLNNVDLHLYIYIWNRLPRPSVKKLFVCSCWSTYFRMSR